MRNDNTRVDDLEFCPECAHGMAAHFRAITWAPMTCVGIAGKTRDPLTGKISGKKDGDDCGCTYAFSLVAA